MMAVSAGVAQLEGAGGNADVSSAIQAACDQRGPSDLERMADPLLAQANPILCEVTEGFVGGPVAGHRQLARLMSPLRHVSGNAAPMLILHGAEDATVPVVDSQLLHAALQQAGADSSLTILPGQGHGWDEELTSERIVEFFRRTLT
jgi:dipeptidyl aminopeptidase/acylaminoacyl peptidase